MGKGAELTIKSRNFHWEANGWDRVDIGKEIGLELGNESEESMKNVDGIGRFPIAIMTAAGGNSPSTFY